MKLLPICNMGLVSPPASPSASYPPSSTWGHRWDSYTVTVMCTHKCTHFWSWAHTHDHAHTHVHTFVVMCTHIHKHSSCASTHAYTCAHTCIHIHIVLMYTHLWSCAHTCIHMHIHMCGQMQTHTSLLWFKSSIFIVRYLLRNLMYLATNYKKFIFIDLETRAAERKLAENMLSCWVFTWWIQHVNVAFLSHHVFQLPHSWPWICCAQKEGLKHDFPTSTTSPPCLASAMLSLEPLPSILYA